jgi:hypothetical protein
MNNAIFAKLYLVEDGVGASDLASPYGVLLAQDLPERLEREATALREGRFAELLTSPASPAEGEPLEVGRRSYRQWNRPADPEPIPGWALTIQPSKWERPAGWMPWEKENTDHFRRRCSNEPVLVGAEGLEPPTPSL